VPDGEAGRAYGFHRAMDHAGGVLGPLVATALLAWGFTVRRVFLAALVPSVLALVAVATVRERPRPRPETAPGAPAPRTPLPRAFRGYLAWIALFSLANSSEAFLLLRAAELGVSTAALPLLWTVLHLSRVGSTYLGGHLADRLPRAPLIAAGWVLFAACYAALGLADATWQVWVVFVAFGLHTGICEPAERVLIRELAPEAVRGRAFGLFHGVVGACAIPAGFGMGWLWQTFGASIALSVAAGLALVAAAGLLRWSTTKP
jgi:MFS family permease